MQNQLHDIYPTHDDAHNLLQPGCLLPPLTKKSASEIKQLLQIIALEAIYDPGKKSA